MISPEPNQQRARTGTRRRTLPVLADPRFVVWLATDWLSHSARETPKCLCLQNLTIRETPSEALSDRDGPGQPTPPGPRLAHDGLIRPRG